MRSSGSTSQSPSYWSVTARAAPPTPSRQTSILPAYDLFIEITTLNQKLVTKKNRKVRRLAELHPDVRVKVLYQRGYHILLVKYGLEEPSQTTGGGAARRVLRAPGPPRR